MSKEKIKKVVTSGPPGSGIFSPNRENLLAPKVLCCLPSI